MSVLFLDTETTGLDPRIHVPWEVAIAEPDGTEHTWLLRPSPITLSFADEKALEIGRFHDRAPTEHDASGEYVAAQEIAELVEGNVLVGSKPSFDVGMLQPLVEGAGFVWAAHHRPVCVATMAYGWLAREGLLAHKPDHADLLALPWWSDELSRACGVEPPDGEERHTALGDARWVRRWYQVLTGGQA